jgi:MFS family permease
MRQPGHAPEDEAAGESAVLEHRPLHATRPAVPTLPEDRQGFAAVLRRRDFRMLWAAQAASQLADKFTIFTLLIVVFSLSGSASLQSVLMIAYTLPSVLLSAPAGVYADRHDKRALMMLTNLLRAALILLIPLLLVLPWARSQAWPLIVITLLFSSIGQVFAPAEAASIPSLVGRGQITEATSVFMTTVILTIVLGVPAATLSIAFIGNDAPFFIGGGLFALAALCVWRVQTNLRARAATAGDAPHVLRELREGLAILRRSPALRLGLYQLALALVVVFTIFALGPVYMVRVLHRSDQQTYIVLVPATVGLVAVAGVLGQVRHFPRAVVLVAAVLTTGATLLLMGVLPSILHAVDAFALMLPVAVVLAVIFGCALAAILVPAFTVLQEKTDEESRGRIFGGIFTVINAAVAVPLLLAGIVSDLVGVDRAVAALGAILMLGGGLVRALRWQRLGVLEDETRALSVVTGR